jgi:hypothetical protein
MAEPTNLRGTMLARWNRLQLRIEHGDLQPTDAQRAMLAQAIKRMQAPSASSLPPLPEQHARGPLPWPGGVRPDAPPEAPALDHPQPIDDEEPPWN